ncbi:hypothetical protein [Komagataeibacter sp. FNDCR2]|uniref:hypothetical protein n=1 Tax=Komagataeibacter sp. FNDCR2 TaxID=2878682 RepID=UPI001E35D60E|nr:hypothetical protein [Komagataeibacter sp. FNDCR2]MCE2576852.1 hypothetical protein [Komagataeibacter sp. FNDCR2]
MKHADCSSVDFQAQRFVEICREIDYDPMYHRKLWEWVFIIHHLRRKNMILPNKRGLVFGVGTEPLPSLFAKHGVRVVATDAPVDIIKDSGWTDTNQHSDNLEGIYKENIVNKEDFFNLVSHDHCDMNNINHKFNNFDFCWSSCCFEHLGNIQRGIDFVINSVEKTLKLGGVACHTTEFNLSSNEHTLEEGPTVIYRKRDIQELAFRLRQRGHEVDEVVFSNSQNAVDCFVDLPPFHDGFPHIRLEIEKYVVTSVGLVITRRR